MTTRMTAAGLRVRSATPADYVAIERLLAANALPLDGVSDALAGFFVAESGEAIVGVTGVEYRGRFGLLRSAAVDAPWRGFGVGRALVERAIAEAKARALDALYLLTTTAEGYFPSFGFVPATRESVPAALRETSEFQGACPASAAVMVLTLPEAAPTD